MTLRFVAPNVTTVYLTLDESSQGNQALVVESATAIGSREQVGATTYARDDRYGSRTHDFQKPAHSQSDFMAFQQLSQQLAKVIRSEPLAPLQSYVVRPYRYSISIPAIILRPAGASGIL